MQMAQTKRNKMNCKTQLSDGRWINTQPLPYLKDTQTWYLRVWHLILALFMSEDEWEKMAAKYLVPQERSYEERFGR